MVTIISYKISNDILILIISFNVDHEAIKTWINFKTISKQFYNRPLQFEQTQNMWKFIAYILHKIWNKLNAIECDVKWWLALSKYDSSIVIHHWNWLICIKSGVVVNCTHDTEEINNNLYCEDDIFKDEIGDNFSPKGYEWKFECFVLSDKLEEIDGEIRYILWSF